MFIPVEGDLSAAVQAENTILTSAFEKNIIMVSLSTLPASLRTIENIWKYEYQSKNAHSIADAAGRLYDKFISFISDLEDVGKAFDSTHKSHEKAFSKLSSGRGNLVRVTGNLKKLGASFPKKLLDSLLQDEDEFFDEADNAKNGQGSDNFILFSEKLLLWHGLKC